jgi:hypothetical protein
MSVVPSKLGRKGLGACSVAGSLRRLVAMSGALLIAAASAETPDAMSASINIRSGVLVYAGERHEDNTLDVRRSPTGYEVAETGARMTVGRSCRRLRPQRARCSANGVTAIVVHAGDADDSVVMSKVDVPLHLIGGDGDDWLVGGSKSDVLEGGPGDDTLEGDEQRDRLFGEDGSDDLSGDAGSDVAHGGDGDDVVAGETDNDLVIGGDGGDDLSGDEGHDSLLGGGDNDLLNGGSGLDSLLGATGDDWLFSSDGETDLVDCGRGLDTFRADPLDGPSQSCEPPPPFPPLPSPPPGPVEAPAKGKLHRPTGRPPYVAVFVRTRFPTFVKVRIRLLRGDRTEVRRHHPRVPTKRWAPEPDRHPKVRSAGES